MCRGFILFSPENVTLSYEFFEYKVPLHLLNQTLILDGSRSVDGVKYEIKLMRLKRNENVFVLNYKLSFRGLS